MITVRDEMQKTGVLLLVSPSYCSDWCDAVAVTLGQEERSHVRKLILESFSCKLQITQGRNSHSTSPRMLDPLRCAALLCMQINLKLAHFATGSSLPLFS